MIGPIEYLKAKYGPHVETIGGRRIGQCWPALQLGMLTEIESIVAESELSELRVSSGQTTLAAKLLNEQHVRDGGDPEKLPFAGLDWGHP